MGPIPDYRRFFAPGGTFFFTLVTHERRPIFHTPLARRLLREAIAETRRRRPFDMPGVVLLPDHLHCLWTLPHGDADFSTRWRKIKEAFTRAFLAAGGREATPPPRQRRKGQRGVWQQGFWEHTIRDEEDFGRHLDYIHFNPVKHELVRCAHDWPHSSFHRWVERGFYDAEWCSWCRRRSVRPDFSAIAASIAE